MIKNYQCMKVTQYRPMRIAIWGEFVLTILLIIFLFPGSQFLLANQDDPGSVGPVSGGISTGTEDQGNPWEGKAGENNSGEQMDHTPEKDPGQISDMPEDQPEIPEIEEEKPSDPSHHPEVTTPIFRGNPRAGKKVVLSFDDGPYAVWTAEYLKVLETYQVPATFFLVGQRVEKYPDIAKKILEKGFEIGSHSYRHAKLILEEQQVVEDDFRKVAAAFSLIEEDVKFFRPPYGAYNNMVTITAEKFSQITVGWNVDPRDWETNDSDKIVHRVLSHVTDGSIIILHEGKKSTLKALPQIITGLQERGFQLVTVSELMEGSKN